MEGDFSSEEFAGIVPRSVNAILDYLEGSDADYSVRVSFLELCKLLCNFAIHAYPLTPNAKLLKRNMFDKLHINYPDS